MSLTTVTSTAPARNGGLVSSLLSVSKGSAAQGAGKAVLPSRVYARGRALLYMALLK